MHGKTRCGECSTCIEWELNFLALMEAALWIEAAGDITQYFNLMGEWGDMLIERGLPR